MISNSANFDIDDPQLPQDIAARAITSGGYPYMRKLKRKKYEARLLSLQRELVKLQAHLQTTGDRVVIVFEGRDAAGKGGTIKTYLSFLNPRHNRIVALPKPNDRERTQWYFQRYVQHLPGAGETVLFDRSWYNRAGVEPVMGFCSPEETEGFLKEAPRFEQMLTDSGIHLFKFWLTIGREMQFKRFHDRRHDPLKVWKLSPIDLKSLSLWDDYSNARTRMLMQTDSHHSPWTVVSSNDKRRARIGVIQSVLNRLEYADKNHALVGEIDTKVVTSAPQFLEQLSENE